MHTDDDDDDDALEMKDVDKQQGYTHMPTNFLSDKYFHYNFIRGNSTHNVLYKNVKGIFTKALFLTWPFYDFRFSDTKA